MSEFEFRNDASDRLPNWRDESFDDFDLVQWIAAAGSLARPDDQLRPQIIAAVKQQVACRTAWKPVLQFASLGICAAGLWLLAIQLLLAVLPARGMASQHLERARQRAAQLGSPIDSALGEVLLEQRQELSAAKPMTARGQLQQGQDKQGQDNRPETARGAR